MKPVHVSDGVVSYPFGKITLQSGERLRKIITVPLGCQFVDLRVTDCRHEVAASSSGNVAVTVTADEAVLMDDRDNHNDELEGLLVTGEGGESVGGNILKGTTETCDGDVTHRKGVCGAQEEVDVNKKSVNRCDNNGICDMDTDNSGLQLVIHALQLYRGVPYRDNEKKVRMLTCVSLLFVYMIVDEIWLVIIAYRHVSTGPSKVCSLDLTAINIVCHCC